MPIGVSNLDAAESGKAPRAGAGATGGSLDPGPLGHGSPPAVGIRSILVGCLLVGFIAAFTPYNDYVAKNTFFIGNYFPAGIISIMAALVLAVNPLLTRLRRRPFSTGELIVMLAMMFVAAAAPSSGLLRYFEPMLISPYHYVERYPWLKSVTALIPPALAPAHRAHSAVVRDYFFPGESGRVHTPWRPFLLPAALWGILIAAVFGAMMFLAAIFRRQWVQHERLGYPLATIPLELMQAPEPGRCYNALWRNPVLWAGAAIPIFVYLLGGLHAYFHAVPHVKLSFSFTSAFGQAPWNHLPGYLTSNRIFFSAVGISFFVPSEVAFSLWFFLVINGLASVALASRGIDPRPMMPVRSIGMYLAYFAGIVWLAREHLASVAKAAWRNAPRDPDEFISCRVMVGGLLICLLVAGIWMTLAGVQAWVAGLIVLLGIVLVTLMARVVAETGIMFIGTTWWPSMFLNFLLGPRFVDMASYYFSSVTSHIFFYDLRENLMPFATDALRLGTDIEPAQRPKLFRWMIGALVLSVLISGVTQHILAYHYGRATMDSWSARTVPIVTLTHTYAFSNSGAPRSLPLAWWNLGLGALVVLAVAGGRLLFAWWPFSPVGLLLMHTWPLHTFWFSIFLGWLFKQLLLRYGGAGAFRRARPFFIGLIVGETLSAGLWMFIGLAVGGMVHYQLLPG